MKYPEKYKIEFEKIYKTIQIISIKYLEIYCFLMKCKYVITENGNPARCSTNGKNTIYFNRKFLNEIPIKQLYFVLMHEVYHCILDHISRLQKKDIRIWNAACDYYINSALIDNGIGERLEDKFGGCLYDKKFDGMFSEKIYSILINKSKNKDYSNFDDHLSEDQSGDIDSNENQNEITLSDSGNLEDNIFDSLDELITSLKEKLENEKNNGKSSSKEYGNNGPEKIIKDATIQYGNGQIAWNKLLKGIIKSNKFQFTYSKINKRNYNNIIFQSTKAELEKTDIHLSIDISSSITYEEIKIFINELYSISKSKKINKVYLYFFNTRITKKAVLDLNKSIAPQINEVLSTLHIGGGTCVKCIFEEIKKKSSDYFIVFSDMYFDYSNIINQNNLIFVSISKEVSPVGKTIKFTS